MQGIPAGWEIFELSNKARRGRLLCSIISVPDPGTFNTHNAADSISIPFRLVTGPLKIKVISPPSLSLSMRRETYCREVCREEGNEWIGGEEGEEVRKGRRERK